MDYWTEEFKWLMRMKDKIQHERRALFPLEFWVRFDREISTEGGKATQAEVETLKALIAEYTPHLVASEAWARFRESIDRASVGGSREL